MNKKYILIAIGFLLIISLIISGSYAYWMMTRQQTNENIVNTGCFSTSFTELENSAINLTNAFPMTDEDGMKTTPYEFTITNTCDTYASYNINLEILNTTTLSHDLIKAVIDDNTPKVATEYESTTATIDGATSYVLLSGGLESEESKTFNLRMWIDESGTLENSQNKIINAKILAVTAAADVPLTLARFITTKIYTGYDGDNDLYYHDGTGDYMNANQEAGDNSYRYSGENPNNFVCFGTDIEPCPEDYLYRIIGVFDDKVKLIKYDYANRNLLGINGNFGEEVYNSLELSNYKGFSEAIDRYSWNLDRSNNWNTSELSLINLNKNFLNFLENKWIESITTSALFINGVDWNIGAESPLHNVYTSELGNDDGSYKVIEQKVSLLYLSDYYYGASPKFWDKNGYDENGDDYRQAISSNWLFMGADEWLLTFCSDYTGWSDYAYMINNNGYVDIYTVNDNKLAIRPVFYLKTDIVYLSGDGSINNPFLISNNY